MANKIVKYGDGGVEFINRSKEVYSQMTSNVGRALTAMGQVGIEMVIDTMSKGYGKDIHASGDLKRSMAFEADEGKQTTTWGSSLEYGPWVHEGFIHHKSKKHIAGRPFLRDGLLNHKSELQVTAAEELKRGF